MTRGDSVRVSKLDWATGETIMSWPATVLRASPTEVVVQGIFGTNGSGPAEVDGVPVMIGDVFTEHYYADRSYNIFHIAAPDGQLKGWYCNIALPARFDADRITFVDLKLDVFVHPDGRATVLDEDEFEAACATCQPADLVEVVPGARSSVEQLLDLARRGALPAPPPPQPSPRGRGGRYVASPPGRGGPPARRAKDG